MALQNAHSGYKYQDIFTALRLVDALLSRTTEVAVDAKLFRGDLFDDLTTVWIGGHRTREQLKHSEAPGPLEPKVFTSTTRDCRLDMLVASALTDHKNNPTCTSYEYRITMSDLAPNDPKLTKVLSPDPTIQPLQQGLDTKCYRFNLEVLWPAADAVHGPSTGPWKRVIAEAIKQGIKRSDFEWFVEHFVVELEAPSASADLAIPGSIEKILIERLEREVGAGTYPNTDRSPMDVAAHLVAAASAAREGKADVSLATLLSRTRLQSDFGSIARAFPVDASKEVTISSTSEGLVHLTEQSADEGIPLLVLGPPGQGKTWACDKLVRDLQQEGWFVANHYCFLNVAEDQGKDMRVRLEAVIGSLLAQIVEQEPACAGDLKPRFAANSEALVTALQKVRNMHPAKKVALVVDGIDHVSRVLGPATDRLDPATALARELSLLELPEGVVLIVACQRGSHDVPLREAGANIYELPGWSKDIVRGLGEKLGVIGTAGRQPDTDGEEPLLAATDPQLDELVDEIATKSKGNALYATYCYRELRRAAGPTHDLIHAVKTLPPFDDTMEAYYKYLLEGVPEEARITADLLAILEFAVNRDELKAVYGPVTAQYIDSTIDRLSPVLVELGMQGGVRVYHESFQRFIRETRLKDLEQRKAVLQPVIKWLTDQGFYKEARAFRFLPSLLAELGDDKAVCDLVDSDYGTQAIAACHGEAAIMKNIAVAAEAAVRLQDWKALIRYTELAKGIATYGFERMENTLDRFSDIPMALYGADWLAKRLLFEGRPVFPGQLGLNLCEVVDKAGGVPPWAEYLEAYESARESDNTAYRGDQERAFRLAQARGDIRLGRDDIDAARIARWLNGGGGPTASSMVKIILDVYQSGRMVLDVIKLLTKKRRAAYLIALARQLPSIADTTRLPSKAALLKRAVKLGLSPQQQIQALGMGVDPRLFSVEESGLNEQTKAVLVHDVQWNEARLTQWVASVMIAAHNNPDSLRTIKLLIQGKGWYRCWLEYVIELARHNAAPSSGSILPAFKILMNETNPFAGDPRACDLYRIHSLIGVTLRLGLKRIKDEEWAEVLKIMGKVSDSTTCSLQGSLSGPLTTELLLQLATEYTSPERKEKTDSFMAAFFKEATESSTYYDAIAEYYLLYARLAIASGDMEKAQELWVAGAKISTYHGHRKDRTLFELLDSMPSLIGRDIGEARKRLARLKPLVYRVRRHTDLKETRHAAPSWWELLAKADGVAAGNLIAGLMLETPNRQAGALQDAQFQLFAAQGERISPVVRFACRLSLGYQTNSAVYDIPLLKALEDAPIDDLPIELAADSITSLVQNRVLDDHYESKIDTVAVERLAQVAESLNAHELMLDTIKSTAQQNEISGFPRLRSAQSQVNSRILIDWGSSPIDIARAMRRWSQRTYDLDIGDELQDQARDRAVEALGWRLLMLCHEGNLATAENLIRFLAEHLGYRNPGRMMSELAQGFERHGIKRLAVISYVYAYTRSRGGGGWLTLGGQEQEAALRSAVKLDAKLAFDELGASIVEIFNGKYYGTQGVTQALVDAFSAKGIGDDTGINPFDLWDAAADVIEERLPSMGDDDLNDDPYIPTQAENDTVPALESAVAATVVGGLAHPERALKRISLLGTAWLIKLSPGMVGEAVRNALKSSLDPGAKTWLLWLILNFETVPYPITLGCRQELEGLAQSDFLTVRALARQLLTRAGIASPPIPATTAPPNLEANLLPLESNEQKKNYILASKEFERCAGERLMLVEDKLPKLGGIVIEKLGQQFSTKDFQRAYRSQIEGLSHATSSRPPDAYTLEQEAVEGALQEAAATARVMLAKEGGIVDKPEQFEDDLAAVLIDNPELPLRVEGSRIPRPSRLPVLESLNTANTPPRVQQGPYKGWYILGVCEKEVTPGDRFKKVERATTLTEGGAEVCSATASHDHPSTFGYGVGLLWLSTGVGTPHRIFSTGFKGPLVGMETGTVPEYFGLGVPRIVLAPHHIVVNALKLKPGPVLDGLNLVDEQGQKALVARTWRTSHIEGEDYGPAYPLIEGTDILLRPDLFDILEVKMRPNLMRFCCRKH